MQLLRRNLNAQLGHRRQRATDAQGQAASHAPSNMENQIKYYRDKLEYERTAVAGLFRQAA